MSDIATQPGTAIYPMDVSQGLPHLPQKMTELTATWLSAALSLPYPGAEVTTVHFGTVVHGTNTGIRLLLSYNDTGHSHRLPATMYAKCGFEPHSHSSHMAECLRSEVVFYRQRDPEVLVNAPKCYFAGLESDAANAFLLLEDLPARNASFGSALRPVNAATAQCGVEMMARYHARWWNSPGTVRREISAGAMGVTEDWMSPAKFEQSTKLARFEYVPAPLRDRERFRNAIYKMWDSNAKGPHCLLHGDLHLGNCYFDADGNIGFLDGQGDSRGCWAHDFTEFLMTSLDIEMRRKLQRELLELYLQQLRSHGVEAPGFESAWRQYRRNTLWVGTAAVCPVSSQFESTCSAYTQRAMAAVTDLDALGALDE